MTFFLRELDGTNGFIIRGTTLNFSNQISISNLGDVNGDGIDDFIIGSRNEGPVTTGAAFVIFGDDSMAGFPTNFDLSTLDGTNGFTVSGVSTQDFFGRSVSGIGDINGDGIDDILIGAHGGDPAGAANAGRAYVVFGVDSMASFPANFDVSTLDGANGFVINGETANDFMASTVSSIGDINGDGYADIIMGSFANTGSQSIYVVLGQNGGFSASIDVSALSGSDGFALHGITFADAAGTALSSAGDINGDGYDDILIGAYLADPAGSATGEAYVFLGRDDSTTAFAADFDLSDLLTVNGGNGSEGFVINGYATGESGGIDGQAGFSVSSAGDFNNDGFDDYIIGAPRANSGGQTYVVFGRDNSVTAFDAEFELSDLLAVNGGDGTLGFVLQGEDVLDLSGFSVSNAGDVNGDGIEDILIGATGGEGTTGGFGGTADYGKAYIVFGTTTSFGASLDLSTLDGTKGFIIEGISTADNLGYSVSAGGDINGDGFDDILISGDGPTQPTTFFREMGYVIYGSATIGQNAAPVISALEAANAVFVETQGNIFLSDLVEITDANNTILLSVKVAITGGFDAANDSILATVAFPSGITGSYSAATGVYTLQGLASPADYQTAVRTLTYRNLFTTQADATRTITFTVDDGSTTTSVTRDIDMVIDNVYNGDAAWNTYNGGWGNDIINGFAGNDLLIGAAGNDTINGGDGGDQIAGGDGNDILDGGAANDLVYGEDGDDIIFGGAGPDVLHAGWVTANDPSMGTDILHGGDGNDILHGDQGIDTLNGDAGLDTLHGGDNDDTLNGGLDADTLNGDAGDDILHGDEGNDTVNGGADNDMVYGDVGNDTLNGNDGDDSLFGGLGDDLLEGGAGADAFDGGDDTDTVTYITSLAGVSLHMISGGTGGDANGDSFTNIEILTGSNFVDNLTGDTGDNTINGAGGDDTISGGAGVDTLNGDLGDDRLFGGSGDDVLHGGAGNDIRLDGQAGNDTIYGDNGNDNIFGQLGDDLLYGGSGDDFISGSNGVDTMFGELGDDVMIGGNGNDIMDGGMGIDRVVGGGGDDTVLGGAGTFADRLFGQAGNDMLDGGAGDDFMTGELGNDTFIGGAGNDSMYGSVGMDTLSGGTGNDLLNGGADVDRLDGGTGADKLIGGTGADVFVFDFGVGASGRDTIFDFAQNSDKIEISGGLVYADLTFTLSPNGQHTTISYNSHEIYVKNTTPAELDAAQFAFIPLAEVQDADKQLVSEELSVVDKAVIADVDSFQFTDKTIVSEDASDQGDTAIYHDAVAELLSYVESQSDIYINAEAVFEIGYDANISYYTDFFNFA